jgi:hypothetical protein
MILLLYPALWRRARLSGGLTPVLKRASIGHRRIDRLNENAARVSGGALVSNGGGRSRRGVLKTTSAMSLEDSNA